MSVNQGFFEIINHFSKKVTSATYYSKVPYTKVVVAIVGGSGEVITAYPAKNPFGGTKGEAIYSANNENQL